MTKEELLALELNEEQIAEVFKINGKDIEKAKGDLVTKETELETKTKELETLQGQLKKANKQIEDFKEMDVEGIKKAADDYKEKYDKAIKDAEKEIETLKFEHSLENALTKAGAKNVKAAKALLDIESLKDSKNIDKDLEIAITTLKESDEYLFGETDPTGTGGSLGGGEKQKGNSDSKASTDDFISAIREVQAKRE
ncbi:phage scaffolding protein [Tissierella sp.]|uniref:phage scaffolding protein n=1 Tax=Tissierella sp. TaxID=41274 RepID=UPI0028B2267F|nr:phage scaffolding protein [Tissierella sp.]